MRLPIRTERLELSPLDDRQIDDFVAYRRIPEVARYQSWSIDYPREAAEALVAEQPSGIPDAGEWLQLAVRDAATGTLLGDVAVHTAADQPDTFELGVTLAPAAQGRGIATEALTGVISALFEAGAHRVFAQCDARNSSVRRLLNRVGMRREASLIDADWFKGEWTTVETFAMLAGERPAAS